MSNLSQTREGPGADTGNPSHFAQAASKPSSISLPGKAERLERLIENNLPNDVIVCESGDVEDRWPLDSGDFNEASAVDCSDFAHALAQTPDWRTNLESFSAAIPEDYLLCIRDSSAWSVGTMSPEDFIPLTDDHELVQQIHQTFIKAENH